MIQLLISAIGLLIFFAGLYYWVKEKADAESRRIYSVVSAVGMVIGIAGALMWLLTH